MNDETKQERIDRQNRAWKKMLKEIEYKNEGEIFLKALNNACLAKLQSDKYYQVE